MFRAGITAPIVSVILAAFAFSGGGAAHAGPADPSVINRGVVELETGRAADISVRMAEDIAGIIDDGGTRRVVPVVGKGALQTLADLRFLRGIDLAIVPSDALDYAREQHFLPGIESSLTYVAKLYNEEFHLLVGAGIKKIGDLANQTINVDAQGSSTAVTATRLFALLQIKVSMTTDNEAVALAKLRSGKIAALAFVGAKPVPFLREVKAGDDLHLLSIPFTPTLVAAYPPTRLTTADYPDLVAADHPVDTVAVGSVLMAADLRMVPDRYRNVANFVDALFTDFQVLLEPGHQPKWREVSIAADLPGWTRYPPAQQWLQRNTLATVAPSAPALKELFARFIDERREASGGAAMSTADKDALFQQFQAWQHGQAR